MKIFGINFGKDEKPLEEEKKPQGFSNQYYDYDGYQSSKLRNQEVPWLETYNNKGYVWFGPINLFPQSLNSLYNTSGLHSAIIDFKNNLISGGGFELEGEDGLEAMKKLELSQFVNFINESGDLDGLLYDMTQDWLIHNTIYLKLNWNSDKTRLLKVDRLEPSKMRVEPEQNNPEKIKKYYYCFDWNLYGTYGTKDYPAFDVTKKKQTTEVIRFIKKNPQLNFYTLPDYISGRNWIDLDGNISQFHNSNIQNSVSPSMIFQFNRIPDNREEQREIERNVRNAVGPLNTGRPAVLYSNGPELAPTITPVEVSKLDKQFDVTAQQASLNICYAHKINPTIMGLPTPKGLGDGELDLSFEVFNKGEIQPIQRQIESIVNMLLHMNQLDVKFVLNEVELFTKKRRLIKMATTLFVSENYIKEFTPIGDLVQWSDIRPTAELSQDSFIQDILGTNFYVYLQGKYEAQTLSTNEISLMARIKPALAHRAAEMCVPFINYQLKNKGLMTQTGDFSSGSDLDTVRYIRNEVQDRAEFYEQRLINYLCDNSSLFPQYTSDNSDDMKPNSDTPYNPPLSFI